MGLFDIFKKNLLMKKNFLKHMTFLLKKILIQLF